VAQDQKKQWKDRAEYDLFDSANKEQNANTKLQILNNWKQKYPASDFKVDRQETIMTTYQAMGNAKEMLNAAKELVSLDAKSVKGLYWINLLTVSLQDKSPEALDAGDSAPRDCSTPYLFSLTPRTNRPRLPTTCGRRAGRTWRPLAIAPWAGPPCSAAKTRRLRRNSSRYCRTTE